MPAPGASGRRAWLGRLVVLVALHSYGVGLALLAVPGWGARLGGWDAVHPTFFMRQAGVFHFLIATVYLAEWRRDRSVRFLLLAKATAVVFLGGVWLLGSEPWVVPVSGLADGAMGLAVWVLARRAGVPVSPRPARS